MMNPRGWRLLGAGLCVTGVVLAGCGDDSSSPDDDSQPTSPLAEFFGWEQEWDGDREATEEERQQHHQIQEYIVTCMQEAGFEYHPEPFWGDREEALAGNDPHAEAWALREEDPEAFAREYGYGATTIRYEETPAPESPDPSDDPNWEYRESLSEAAREEYEKALWGDWEAVEEASENGEATEYDPAEVGGCQNEAYDEIYGLGGEEEAQFEDLMQRWEELDSNIQSDPRLAEARQAWSSCMAEAGYPGLEELYDAENRVYDRQQELYGWDVDGEGGLPSPTGEEGAEPTPFEPPEPDPDALAEVQEFELAIAWADFECRRDHDVERIEQEVRFEHEERFIEDNRADLEAYRDWQNERGIG